MSGNLLNLVFRKILLNPLLSFINILCLSAGMITILFISLWIKDELSYDRFHPTWENIYRLSVKVDNTESGYHSHFARSYYPWLFEMKDKVPGIKNIARLNISKNSIISTPSMETFQADVIMTDPSVFEVFWFSFLEGSPQTAFKDPFSVVLTESAAMKYFGSADVLGQNLQVYCDRCLERKNYNITGIIEDYPSASHFHFDLIGNLEDPANFNGWAYYYLLLDKQADPEDITGNFSSFAAGYLPEEHIKNLEPDLQPISDIHLRSDKDREIEINGNYRDIWLFLGLSVFVLSVSLFNFINVRHVSLMRSSRTLSLMRIHGASRRGLFFHLLTESFILSLTSLVLAVIVVMLFLPAFNRFTGKIITAHQVWQSPGWWLILAGLIAVAGFAGVIPFISGSISNRIKSGSDRNIFTERGSAIKKLRLTRVYVVLQFAASLVLIITVLVVNSQVKYFMDQRLGKGMGKILNISNVPVQVSNNYQVFKAELLKNPLIYDVTSSFENPADENMDMMKFETTNVSEDVKDKLIFVYPADDNFFSFYGIKFLSGSGFPAYFGNDSLPESYILNKKACDFLGWEPEDAVDRPFCLMFSLDGKNLFNGGRITGVVEDFQMSSMKNEIKPYVFFQKSFWMGSVQVKFDTGQVKTAFNFIKMNFEKAFPGFPMQYSYVEDLYKNIYKNEFRLKELSLLLGILAIVLSSLGLWGITGIIYQAKTREIGIRKVNGASRGTIISWLLRDINQVVFFSILCGIPLSYFLMKNWLVNFSARVNLEWWMFVFPALFVYLVALLTVAWQANQAAGMNPVDSLRCE